MYRKYVSEVKLMSRLSFAILLCILVSACSSPSLRVAKIDDKTGLLQTEATVQKASILHSKKLTFAKFKGMAYVTGLSQASRMRVAIEQIKSLGYFDEVLDSTALANLIHEKGIEKSVMNIDEPIGLNRVFRKYKPFLWIQFRSGGTGASPFEQLVVTNPETLEIVFISQANLSFLHGLTNEEGFYPLINSLIEWINQNK